MLDWGEKCVKQIELSGSEDEYAGDDDIMDNDHITIPDNSATPDKTQQMYKIYVWLIRVLILQFKSLHQLRGAALEGRRLGWMIM